MAQEGSCHCGRIAFTLEGEVGDVIDCNCSMCRRKGALLAAFPRDALTLKTPEADMGTYKFNKHLIDHHFCLTCGISPFSEGKGRDGKAMTMVNVRCLPDVDLSGLKVIPYDGASV
jgi:hypothetical protein